MRFIFVGGKGGVGKTTTAAALAVRLAKSGKKTIVVSTDPAHSLGDALAVRLTGAPQLVSITDVPGRTSASASLHAMEIDPAAVVEDLRKSLKIQHIQAMLRDQRGGLGTGFLGVLAKLGVDLELIATLLEMSPPGIDESVALARMMQLLTDPKYSDFERVVIDTAPTGHTLRLLSFPRFLHALVDLLMGVQEKVSSGYLPSFLTKLVGDDIEQQLRVTKANLEHLMDSMSNLNSVLTDPGKTDFIVVSIPTHLAVAESKRLMQSLAEAAMPARYLVVNQSPREDSIGGTGVGLQAMAIVDKLQARRDICDSIGVLDSELLSLRRIIEGLQTQRRDAQVQIKTLQEFAGTKVKIALVPTFGTELIGVVALDLYAQALCETPSEK